jgi:diguanylate cyclase (GGDEF)-like protein
MLKKIAVIISGIDEEYQNTILRGIQDCALKNNVSVMHFIAFGGILQNNRHDAGEYNIYRLCSYAEFDGVILLTNTISEASVTGEIVKNIQQYDIPVVSIDNDLDVRFHHIGIDNFCAMQEMVRHVIELHKCRNIGYISGPESNPESILRYQAFEHVMQENGMRVTEEAVYYGSFRSCDGRDGAIYFLNRPEGIPDAIICANDAMALSTVLTLEEHGVRVPEDVIVTGFDNTYAARNFAPAISSVERPLYRSGYLAVEKILGLCGPEVQRSVLLPTHCVFRSSCGCAETLDLQEELKNNREFRKSNFRRMDFYQINVPMVNRMSCSLAESDNFKENLETLRQYVLKFGCQRFYLCLNENWNEIRTADSAGQKIDLIASCQTMGYTENMLVPLAYCNGRFSAMPPFPSARMLPPQEQEMDTAMMYYILPLHFRDRSFGYCVLCSNQFNAENPLLHSWVMNIANSLETIRKMEHLDKAMRELDKLYVIDPLCKINNRNGFNKYSHSIFETCKSRHSAVMLMFIDMDGLKMINDTYSHEEGDNSLYQLSRAIRSGCRNGELCARFGGDEFIIFAPEYTEEKARELANCIQAWLDDYNVTSGKPYKIGASIGWYICTVDEDSHLYPLITAADKKMYEEKKRKRVSRYLRH